MVSRPLAIAGVLAVLLAGGVGFALASGGPVPSAENATVSVSADATVERAPDRATVTVAAVGRGETAAAARNNLSGDADAVQGALEDAGANVTSARFSIHPEYERTETGREQVGYVAVHTVEAETSDVDAVGSLIDVAVDAGADRVEGITYGLSEQTRQDARQEALTTAMDRARTDAETVAAAEERSVDGVAAIQTSDSGRYVVRAEMAADAGSAGGSTVISPGPVTVDAAVQVTYELG
ncbi:SIMPL domain-containing protein [Haloarcula nitratireducens]|uniref:SIMPL domain-containing protein n=1 Tax=Haloarcula nitratireducens TaxID=2487749 RepID=A0AAW4PD59_9EURY|nr:SIMPL domain-containing protein [Halomicroarcula nitratireducens]MBX0295370.1 SIMPL domain-containing protein [Halomicroarcula nitratireducens]